MRWGAFSGLASNGVVALLSLFSASLTIHYLGKEAYGLWVIATSFLVWAQLFDFGLLNGITNALSEAFGRDDYSAARRYVSTAFVATLCLSLCGLILWCYFPLRIPWDALLRLQNPEQGKLLGKGIALVGSFFLITLPFALALKILQAYQRMYIVHSAQFICYLLSLAAVIIGISLHAPFLELLLWVNTLPYLCPIACFLLLARKCPWARVSWKCVDRHALKRLCFSSVLLFLYQLLSIAGVQMIPLALTYATNLKNVADFHILWRLFQFILVLTINISASSHPAIRDAFERGETSWIRHTLLRVLFFQGIIVFLSCLPLLLAGNFMIEAWIRMPLENPLRIVEWGIFALSLLFFVFSTTVSTCLNFLDKIAWQILLSLVSGVCLFYGISFGAPWYGLMAIFVTLLATSSGSFFLSLRLLKRLGKA